MLTVAKPVKPLKDYPWFLRSEMVKCPDIPIGKGGYSKVYLGELRGISRVAVKILNPQECCPDISLHRETFIREIETWWRLKSHPNVCLVYCAGIMNWKWDGRESECFFIAAKYMKNGNCSEYSKGKPLEVKLKLLREVALGMAHLHEQNIVHADLKPDNTLVDDNGCALVVDFGAAKTDNFDETIGNRAGTLSYIPPERFEEGAVTREAGDIFAFAITMYSILSEGRPYGSKDTSQILDAIVKGERPDISRLTDIPEEVLNLLQRCWAHNPSDRPFFVEIAEILRPFA
ncbi:kinase-like protein [Gonapodya prolifera JEL478]|uniref:Kinase-like protein n=1 Tax=Gonapodya prolifera (strain JEL478) TaxID=1344416 RepID=A0A139AC43_GONPJ|nr:kinase-like protein [Gonapodya prolifera JEL478]|eukprot:KXS14371.1 kinase-like protein [Gonapodya prolifera JEL478]